MNFDADFLNKFFSFDRVGHAYLLKCDISQAIEIAKFIFKQSKFIPSNLDNLIKNQTYSDLKIIRPDGQWIKKEQILDLKSEYKSKSIYGNKRVYIVANAENLNKSSANTILKFLEEPDDDVIALLITNNVNKVIQTIVSRCQYLVLNKINNETGFPNNEYAFSIFEKLENYEIYFEPEFQMEMARISDRNEIKCVLNDILSIYDMLLNLKINGSNYDKYNKYLESNSIDDIQKKVNALIFTLDSIEYNVNIKLLIDKLLFLMFGVD